jgi:GTP-binding protein
MKQNIIDSAQFSVTAGKGGDGAISFRREKYIPKGGPDGGRGGKGGSVIITSNPNINTLRFFAGKNRFEAHSGQKGGKRNQFGEDAANLTLEVPVGTQIYVNTVNARMLSGNELYGTKDWEELEEREKPDKRTQYVAQASQEIVPALTKRFSLESPTFLDNRDAASPDLGNEQSVNQPQWLLVKDFTMPRESMVIAQGGKQGHGNAHYKSSRVTTPKFAQRGEGGEVFEIRLELKVLADVGLVGLPNVGKSTLLSVLTRAQPEIANYPFTTLSPNLGVLVLDNQRSDAKDLVIADIPGLIEGASEGKGLGDQFLKHVERCRMLIYVLGPMDADLMLSPDELAKALQKQLAVVEQEVAAYSPLMQEKPRLIVINKTDVMSEEQKQELKKIFAKHKPLFISAVSRQNLEKLVEQIAKLTESSMQ